MKAMVIMVIMVQREMRIVKVVITVQRKREAVELFGEPGDFDMTPFLVVDPSLGITSISRAGEQPSGSSGQKPEAA